MRNKLPRKHERTRAKLWTSIIMIAMSVYPLPTATFSAEPIVRMARGDRECSGLRCFSFFHEARIRSEEVSDSSRRRAWVERTERESIFMVYTTAEIDALFNQQNQNIESLLQERDRAIEGVRTLVRDVVVATLRALPQQLFSDEVRAHLAEEVAVRLETILEQRLQAVSVERERRLASLEERLLNVEQQINARR